MQKPTADLLSGAFTVRLMADRERRRSFAAVVKLAVRARIGNARDFLPSSGTDVDELRSSFASKNRKLFLHPGAARWHGGR